MKEFKTAKIKLSLWYTVVILFISLLLSSMYYLRTIQVLRIQYQQIELKIGEGRNFRNQPLSHNPKRLEYLEEDFANFETLLQKQLLIINVLVMIAGGTASYFLAGKTLLPIQEYLKKQKRFIADAAHELKTPLTALKTSLEVELLDKKLNQSSKKVLKNNLKDVDSLASLTENLLSLARIDDKKFVLDFEKVELKKVIKRSVAHIMPLANKKKIKIKTSNVNQSISGNENSLVEAVMIILDNAIKYSDKNTNIKIIGKSQKNKTILKIIDQGIGMDEKHLSQIFDRFYRVEESRTNIDRKGYGLGLAVAKKIIDQHGGKITVESKLNKGSIFTLVF